MFPSRSAAAASVLAGNVLMLPDRRRAAKPGQLVSDEVGLEVVKGPPFVSRGGVKLRNALTSFVLDVSGRRALDVGASTGGFTDCLLQGGAAHVVALDVAYGELDWKLRTDPRVTVIERSNARALRGGELPYSPDLIVIDVSFISLAKVLGAVLGCMDAGYDVLALVKPQFELGRGRVGKGGVVRTAEDRREALIGAGQAALALGAVVVGYYSSQLPGPKGNRETFIWLADPGGAQSARSVREPAQLQALAREVEP